MTLRLYDDASGTAREKVDILQWVDETAAAAIRGSEFL